MRPVAGGALGAGPPRLRLSVATKAAAVAASRTQEPPMLDDLLAPPVPADTDDDAGQAPSPAVHPLDEQRGGGLGRRHPPCRPGREGRAGRQASGAPDR